MATEKKPISLNDMGALEKNVLDNLTKPTQTKNYNESEAISVSINPTLEKIRFKKKDHKTLLTKTHPGRVVSLVATMVRELGGMGKPVRVVIEGLKSLQKTHKDNRDKRINLMVANKEEIITALKEEFVKNFPKGIRIEFA